MTMQGASMKKQSGSALIVAKAYQSYSGMLGAGLGRVDESLGLRYRMFAELQGKPTPRQLAGTAGGHAILGDMVIAEKYLAAAGAAGYG